jgi:NADPH2:quinone reductase
MKALIFDPEAKRGLRLSDVAEPQPSRTQALIEAHAVSLNLGNSRF